MRHYYPILASFIVGPFTTFLYECNIQQIKPPDDVDHDVHTITAISNRLFFSFQG